MRGGGQAWQLCLTCCMTHDRNNSHGRDDLTGCSGWSDNLIMLLLPDSRLHACMPTCLQAHLPACTPANLPACTPACKPTCLHAHLPTCLHAHLPACPPDCIPTCLHAHLHASPPACMPTWLHAHLTVPPVCLPATIPLPGFLSSLFLSLTSSNTIYPLGSATWDCAVLSFGRRLAWNQEPHSHTRHAKTHTHRHADSQQFLSRSWEERPIKLYCTL